MRRLLLGVICLALTGPMAFAAAAPAKSTSELSLGDALILGVVEGVTEYLPVSSTGHLIIATHLLGLKSTEPLAGRDGQPLWYKKPSAKHPAGVPLTTALAADTFTIVIQFGAIAAVAVLYWRQLLAMLNGLRGRDPAGLRLLRNLLIAFVPSAILGLALSDWIGRNLFSIGAVIAAQVVGAGFILWIERYRRHRDARRPATARATELTPRQALNIGLLQCFALWPGTSRSMMTIAGGYLAGLDPRQSAEFSFLLGLVTLTAATGFKSYESGAAMIQVFGWPHVLIGCVVAALTAALAVRFLVSWLSRHGMTVFAWYRLAFAAVLAAIMWL